jgi:hypothetical protein
MTPRTYASPEAFKQALEQRPRTPAKSGADFARKRQLLVFDRFLARVVDVFGGAVTLKGGLVLELRLARARTTKDVDLRMVGAPDEVLANLQEAGRRQLGDFMLFEVGPDDDHPKIQNDGMQYEGHRFRAVCKLAGKIYGQPFGVDIAFGDPIFGEPEIIVAEDVLAFAGIAPPTVRVYPIETHIAEKLHAYTMPRERPNSRVKDLPDLALLATARSTQRGVLPIGRGSKGEVRGTGPRDSSPWPRGRQHPSSTGPSQSLSMPSQYSVEPHSGSDASHDTRLVGSVETVRFVGGHSYSQPSMKEPFA